MEKLRQSLDLSTTTLGTMRFYDKQLGLKEVLNIIETSFDIGIDTHHSSFEYNSFNLYTKALNLSSNKKNIKHIIKLASPHFEEHSFSSKSLELKIDTELKNLNIEQIDVLQWLLRSKPINDNERLNILSQQVDEIENCLYSLKKKGKIKSVFSFPYSVPFASEVIKLEQIDGIISYLNIQETEFLKFANKSPFIAIRPFFAGTLLRTENKNQRIKECLQYVNAHKSVLTKIVSLNSVDQLQVFKE